MEQKGGRMLVWWKAVLLAGLFIAVTLVVGLVGGLAISLSSTVEDTEALAAQEVAILPWLLAASIVLASLAVWAMGRKHVPWTPSRLRHTVRVGLLFLAPTVVLVIGATLLQAFILELLPIGPERYPHDPQQLAQLPFWVVLVTWVFVPAVFEEIAFRGVIQPGLTRAHGALVGVLLSSVLFALVHLEPVQMAAVFIMGLAFGYLRHASRSVYPAMVAHGFLNFLAVVGMRAAETVPTPAVPPAGGPHPFVPALWGLGCVILAVAMCRGLGRRLFPVTTPPPPDGAHSPGPPRPESGGG